MMRRLRFMVLAALLISMGMLSPGNAIAQTQNGLGFDGSDDYVSFSQDLSGTTAFTYEAWVYVRSNQAWARILDFGNYAGYNMFLTTSQGGTGQPRFAINIGGGEQVVTAPSALPLYTWTHVAVTVDGSTASMYINGALVDQNTSFTYTPASMGATTNNYIGKSQYADPYFSGSLDEVRMWNVARTGAQIAADMNTSYSSMPSGLIHYYKCNQGTSGASNPTVTSLTDAAGTANGTLNNFLLNGHISNWVCGATAFGTCPYVDPACTPSYYYAYYACYYDGMSIYDFSLPGENGTSISDISSGCDGSGYQDRRGVTGTVNMVSGNSYTVSTLVGSSYTMALQVWIDFNNDGYFTADETVGGRNAAINSSTFSISIPSGAAYGTHLMRISAAYNYDNSYPSLDACGSIDYGEAQDYTVNILPITGNLSPCVGTTNTLTMAGLTGGTWSSSNTAVATIGATTGIVSALAVGSSNISYTTATDTQFVVFNVYNPPAAPGPITGNTTFIGGTVLYDTTSGGVWSSGNSSIATINSSTGVVHSTANGSAVISYTASSSAGCGTAVTTSITGTFIGTECSPAYNYADAACTIYGITLNDFSLTGEGSTSISDIGTGCDGTGYQSRIGIVAPVKLSAGKTYSASGSIGYYNQGVQVWIDFNNDGSLTSDEIVGGGINFYGTFSFSVTLPAGAAPGPHAMRVRTSYYGSYPYMDPCSDLGYGETQDYLVTVTPITGNTTPCIGSTTTLTDTAVAGGTWSSSNTAVATIGSGTGIVSALSIGTTNITYTTPGDTESVTITVYGYPAVGAITGNTTFAGSTALYDTTAGGTWSSSNTAIATIGSATGFASRVANGTARISYTVSNPGCATTVTTNITAVTPTPALDFDGGDDYVGVASPSGLPVGNSNYTIEAWIKPSYSNSGGIVGWGNYGTDNEVNALRLNGSTQLHNYWWDNDLTVNVPELADGNWHHVAATFDGTTRKIYCDGILRGADMPSGHNVTTMANMRIGSTDYGEYFPGGIDEVRIWNVARTATELGAAMNCDVAQNANLKAYYRFNQGTPGGTNTALTSAYDYSGNGNCGTYANFSLTGTSSNYVSGAVSTCNAITIATSAGTITGPASVDSAATITLTDTISGGTWSASNSHATVSAGGVVTGVTPGVTVISYTNACGGVATKSITVKYVLATPTTGSLAICAATATTLTNATGGGAWSSGNIYVATVNSYGVVTGLTAGTAAISYTVSGSTTVSVVTVNPFPSVITGSATLCADATATYTNTLSGGTWTTSNTAIATINSTSGLLTPVAAGTINVSYTMSTGCYKTKSVVVNPLPGAIGGALAICVAGTTTLTDTTTGAASWASSTPAVATIVGGSGVITGIAAGTTTITYTLATGCKTTAIVTVAAAPAITGSASVCAAGTTALSSATAGGTWSSSAAAATIGSSTGIVSGIYAGTANITYNTPGCRSTRVMTVNAQPNAITGTSSVCVGSTGTLSSTTAGGAWSAANTAVAGVSSTGVVTGVSADTTSIIYTMSTGCRRTAVVTVTAAPAITGATSICAGSSATLSSSITGGTWSSSNTAIATIGATTGILSGVANGAATVTYNLSSGCRATTAITVSSGPAAIAGTSAVCLGSTITLSDATPSGTWSSSNTAVASIGSTTGIVSGISAGTAMVTYVTGAGCYRTQAITVGSGAATVTGHYGICTGASNTLSASITGASWSSSNTSVVTIGVISGVATGVAPGVATITFTPYASGSSAGCITTVQVTVNTGVTMASISGTPYVGVGATTNLTDATPGGVWSSSNAANATVSATGVVTGVSASLPTISYKVTTGACEQLATLVVHVVGSRPGAATAADAEMVRVYPNPTTGNFAVEAPVAGIFAVFTLEGKELMRSSIAAGTNQLSLPHGIAAGIYMCRYIGEDGSTIMVRLVYEQ